MAETIKAPAPVVLRGARTRTVPLEYPVELADGKRISEVTVRRMTLGEMKEFIAAATEERDCPLPMFSVSAEILDALDPDDFDELHRVATEMLPRRLRRALDAVVQDQPVEAAAEPPLAAAQS